MMSNEVIFDYPAPKADVIVEEISKISGLPVLLLDPYVNESEVDEDFDEGEELYDFYNRIAFKYFPEHMIDIYAYIPDAVNKSVEKEKLETGFDANWPRPSHGADEKQGKQSIYIRSHMPLDPSLSFAINAALKALGGKYRYENSKEIPSDYFPITHEKLTQNYKIAKRKMYKVYFLFIVLLPITIPVGIIQIIIGLIKMPFEMRKTYKAVKEHYPEHFKDK